MEKPKLTSYTETYEDLGMFTDQALLVLIPRVQSRHYDVEKVVRCDGEDVPFERVKYEQFPSLPERRLAVRLGDERLEFRRK